MSARRELLRRVYRLLSLSFEKIILGGSPFRFVELDGQLVNRAVEPERRLVIVVVHSRTGSMLLLGSRGKAPYFRTDSVVIEVGIAAVGLRGEIEQAEPAPHEVAAPVV